MLTIEAESQARSGHDLLAFRTWEAVARAELLEPVDEVMNEAVARNGKVNPVTEYLTRHDGRWIAVPATPGSQIKGPCSRLDLMKQHAGIDVVAMYPADGPTNQDLARFLAYADRRNIWSDLMDGVEAWSRTLTTVKCLEALNGAACRLRPIARLPKRWPIPRSRIAGAGRGRRQWREIPRDEHAVPDVGRECRRGQADPTWVNIPHCLKETGFSEDADRGVFRESACRRDADLTTALPLAANPANVTEATIRNTGRTASGREHSHEGGDRSRSLRQFSLSRHLRSAHWQVPASAQKQGGSITVGLELDIPGFDPLKVGVFDTVGGNRGGRDFRHADHARRQGPAAAEARAVLDPFRRLQDLDLQAAARRQIS